jgi:hypothetical protein
MSVSNLKKMTAQAHSTAEVMKQELPYEHIFIYVKLEQIIID